MADATFSTDTVTTEYIAAELPELWEQSVTATGEDTRQLRGQRFMVLCITSITQALKALTNAFS